MCALPCKEEVVQLGRSGIFLRTPLGIGTLQWGTTWVDSKLISGGRISDATAEAIVRHLVENHVTFFDSAEGYGGGTSEERIGILRQRAENDKVGRKSEEGASEMIVATKFLPTLWRWTHASFERALRGSLARLQQDSCDVYFLHSPLHPRPIEFWVEAAAICKRKGLLKSMGLSNCNAEQVRRAVAAGKHFGVPISCNQIMFSLLDYRSVSLQATVRACKELDVTVVAYSPIGQGLLTDKMSAERFESNRPAKMTGLTWEQLSALRTEIRAIATERGKSMAQVALNWCICHDTIPLVGCRSVAQSEDTLGCLGWRLSTEEVERLDAVALARSTLDSPPWRRGIFVALAGVLMMVYKVSISLNLMFGSGTSRY
ncbi:Pyridoxal reductase, chloroplastic [Porphyridium purpureum]|uniref:Pyridoxal reductase, chloroplastic n=1 Tax=Porphyridium purpureum TaxID=35688 RepID=A0A5J4Z0J7_PORPP|nr:Pyridoxal reductase, chloroplastic [Porphyridium purpureum]|eukprot:POR3414..scf208_2